MKLNLVLLIVVYCLLCTKEIQVSGVSGGAFVCEFLKSMNYDCGDSNCGAV